MDRERKPASSDPVSRHVSGAVLIPFAAMFWVATAVSAVVGLSRFMAYRDTADWVPTPAVLQSVRVEVYGNPSDTDAGGGCLVDYSYNIGGVQYAGNALTVAPESLTLHEARKHHDALLPKVSSTVLVYVDPRNPGRSAMFRTLTTPWIGFAFGVCVGLAISVGVTVVIVRSLRENARRTKAGKGGMPPRKGNRPLPPPILPP